MNRQNDLHAYMFEQSTHSGVVIACFDAFCQTIKKKTVVLLDNASIHTSEEFEERMPNPLASNQIPLVTVLGLSVSERVE